MLKVPTKRSFTHDVLLNISGLDKTPFYPGVYLKKYQSTQEVNAD